MSLEAYCVDRLRGGIGRAVKSRRQGRWGRRGRLKGSRNLDRGSTEGGGLKR